MSDYVQIAAPVSRPSAPAFGQATNQAFEQIISTMKQGMAAATSFRPQSFDMSQAVKAMQDVSAFNRGTIEAFAQSSQVLVSGSQDLFRQIAAANQAGLTQAVAGFKALAAVKSVKEGVQLQASLTQQSFERALSDSKQIVQDGLKLAERASAPLTERAVLAAETLTRRAA